MTLRILTFLQLCELGNLSIHLALRWLRPAGTKVRKIPFATGNPFTLLFNFVSCPNYTYEIGAWVAFTIMTQCLPGEQTLLQPSIQSELQFFPHFQRVCSPLPVPTK